MMLNFPTWETRLLATGISYHLTYCVRLIKLEREYDT
jgi:hypothetical protein